MKDKSCEHAQSFKLLTNKVLVSCMTEIRKALKLDLEDGKGNLLIEGHKK